LSSFRRGILEQEALGAGLHRAAQQGRIVEGGQQDGRRVVAAKAVRFYWVGPILKSGMSRLWRTTTTSIRVTSIPIGGLLEMRSQFHG
jgi:hypothetical protein